VAVEHVVRNVEGRAEFADFILEEFGQGFEEPSFGLQFEDAVDAVVMGFDPRGLGPAGGAFDHVGVKRALGEEFDLSGLTEKNVDEFIAK
jgi:hypothetical protein